MARARRTGRTILAIFLVVLLSTPVCFASTPTVSSLHSFGNTVVAQMSDGTIWTWGDGNPVPRQMPGISGVRFAFPWGSSYVALKDDGTVWAMSYNGSPPVQLPGLDNVRQISGHSVLRNDGTVWVWSKGTDTGSLPMQVPGLTDIVKIDDCAGLRSDGTLWEWGIARSPPNYMYSFENLSSVQVLTRVKEFSDSPAYAVALREDGTVWTWGSNWQGQLGTGQTSEASLTPVRVSDLASVASISRGSSHALALKSDGSLWGWGDNTYCQLGVQTPDTVTAPVKITSISDIDRFAALGDISIVSKKDGTVWAWGRNDLGQLGSGTASDPSVPDSQNHGEYQPVRVLLNADTTSATSPTATAPSSPSAMTDVSPSPVPAANVITTPSPMAPAITTQSPWLQQQSGTVTPSAPPLTEYASPTPAPADNRPYLSTGMDFNTFAFIGGILIMAGMLAGIGRKKE